MEDVEVPDGMVLGNIGDGWRQVTSELAFERSGPERFLSTFPLFVELVRALGRDPGERAKIEVGVLGARLWTLRRMSLSVAGALEAGDAPEVEAALVKDLGTGFEREVAEAARLLVPSGSALPEGFNGRLAEAISHAPAFTLRGGWAEGLWGELEKAGLTLTSVPEGSGGTGGSLSEAVAVLRLAGRHAAPVPLAETDILAGWALSASGLPVPGGPLTAAPMRSDEGVVFRRVGRRLGPLRSREVRSGGPLRRPPRGRGAQRRRWYDGNGGRSGLLRNLPR